jgi:hypothetical protein
MTDFILFAALDRPSRSKRKVERETWQISSKVTEKEKRRRPNALQQHLQNTSKNGKTCNSLVHTVGHSGALTARWRGA